MLDQILKQDLFNTKCLMFCGGGGVGKTSVSASFALAAARRGKKVLALTIDPSKRLLQSFGFKEALAFVGGAPVVLSPEDRMHFGLSATAGELSIAVLNPKFVMEELLQDAITPTQADSIRKTKLYGELGTLVHSMIDYAAFEWVDRMLREERYDLIVLDTPPAAHAKEFFRAPEKLRNLTDGKMFQFFSKERRTFFGFSLNFSLPLNWIEPILGFGLFREVKLIYSLIKGLQSKIQMRVEQLGRFFERGGISVLVVSNLEEASILEANGMARFLSQNGIPFSGVILNQVDQINDRSIQDECVKIEASLMNEAHEIDKTKLLPALGLFARHLEQLQKEKTGARALLQAPVLLELPKQDHSDPRALVVELSQKL